MARAAVDRTIAIATVLVVAGSVAAALFLIEGPGTMRGSRADETRLGHLASTASAIDCYWTLERKTPADLHDLGNTLAERGRERALPGQCRWSEPFDPEDSSPYEYRPLDERKFELCATFALAWPGENENGASAIRSGGRFAVSREAGRHCFTLTAQWVDVGR